MHITTTTPVLMDIESPISGTPFGEISKDSIRTPVDSICTSFENAYVPVTAIARSPERVAPNLPTSIEQTVVPLNIGYVTDLDTRFQSLLDEFAEKICKDLGHEFGVSIAGNIRVSINDSIKDRVLLSTYQDAKCHSSVECRTPLSAVSFENI